MANNYSNPVPPNIKNLIGSIYPRGEVIGYSHTHVQVCGQKKHYWFCRCRCGRVSIVATKSLHRANVCRHRKEGYKVCTRCGVEKPLTEYYVVKNRKNTTRGYCKQCNTQVMRDWRAKNPERNLAIAKKWRDVHGDYNREQAQKWRDANPELSRENTKRWRKEHKDEVHAHIARRRYEQRGAGGSFTARDIRAKYEAQNGTCVYYGVSPKCQQDLSVGYHIDHIVPIKRGGSNNPDNLQLLCPYCNMSKHDKTHGEFIDYLRRR